MDTDLYTKLCFYSNLYLAYKKARKRKTLRSYIIDFEKNLKENLLQLRSELIFHIYLPRHLEAFVISDPKTRKICKSDFRDRVVHHALCNILEPIYEKVFIYDSYASRKGKCTLKALKRFDYFKRKVASPPQNRASGYCLKADIKKYFENVDHAILLSIIKRRIKDNRVLWLIQRILANYNGKSHGKGMPLGNLTSQFFANVYLHELDHFVKHELRAKYYIRYVDDFVILHKSKRTLADFKTKIDIFLQNQLNLELHPSKSRVIPLSHGINFLGMRVFYYHRRINKKNLRNFDRTYGDLCRQYNYGKSTYDDIYNFIEGWLAFAKNANTYNLRRRVLLMVKKQFQGEMSSKEIDKLIKYRT